MRNKLRHSLATAAAFTGIWALSTTGASAAQLPAPTGTNGTTGPSASADDIPLSGADGADDTPKQDRSPGVGLPPTPGTGEPGTPGRPMWSGPGAHTLPIDDGRQTTRAAAEQETAPRHAAARHAAARHAAERGTTGRGAAAEDAEGANNDVTQKAGPAVSEARPAAAHQDLGAVPGVAAPAAAPSAPGLPEDVVIEVPEVVPGVPSVGIVPLSLPALPVTPSVPSL